MRVDHESSQTTWYAILDRTPPNSVSIFPTTNQNRLEWYRVALRQADRAVATGPSDGRTRSWRPWGLQRLAHRDRVLLVPRIAIKRLGLRVHATGEDDHVRRALLLGQAFEVLHEARGHAEAAGIRLDEEFRHLRIRRWIEGRRDSEARESHESTAPLRHDNRFEALHLTESPGNRPFPDRLAKV